MPDRGLSAQKEWAQTLVDWPAERAMAISDAEGIDGIKIMKRYIVLLEAAGHKFPIEYPIN